MAPARGASSWRQLRKISKPFHEKMQEIYHLPTTTILLSQIVQWELVLDMVVAVFDHQCSRMMDLWSKYKVHKVRR